MSRIYGSSRSLLTDLYEITMAYSYWKTGISDRQAVFAAYFRLRRRRRKRDRRSRARKQYLVHHGSLSLSCLS
jgi:nicotinic acid phosphoribosyltransferase